jgi:phage terminase large subunit-like protein
VPRRSAAPPEDDPTTAYARAVVAGTRLAGRLVRAACARHLRDLLEGPARGLTWNVTYAKHALDFFPTFLKLGQSHAGLPFVLQPWQQFIIGSLFGWHTTATKKRRFRRAYIETGKGSGKSVLLAGIGLYMLAFDREDGAEVYAAAATRDQANIMFRDAQEMVERSAGLLDLITINAHNLSVEPSRSFFRAVSSEAKGLDGKRVHCALIDELHQHPDGEVVDKMRRGTKSRSQALIIEITNSGYDRESVCWYEHEYSQRVVDGIEPNDAWFAYVCQLDACAACRADGKDQPQEGCPHCDDFRDEAVWEKTNPCLDVALPRIYLRELVTEARGMPSKLNDLLRYNFCVWTQAYSRWLDVERWAACGATITDDELEGAPCYGGLDLGMTDDLCAFVQYWALPDGRVAVRGHYWLPRIALEKFPHRPYAVWERAGLLTVTEGDIVDQAYIEETLAALAAQWGIREIAYDKRFAQNLAMRLQDRGIVLFDQAQGFQLNEALMYVHGLVMTGKLCHGGDPILSWAAANMVVRHGTKGEIRPDKDKAREKIDPVVALVMAAMRGLAHPVENDPMITVLG